MIAIQIKVLEPAYPLNVTITGPGVIDGAHPDPLPKGVDRDVEVKTILIHNCTNVRIDQLSIRDSDLWTVHLQKARFVNVSGVQIRNHRKRVTSDGIDVDAPEKANVVGSWASTEGDLTATPTFAADNSYQQGITQMVQGEAMPLYAEPADCTYQIVIPPGRRRIRCRRPTYRIVS